MFNSQLSENQETQISTLVWEKMITWKFLSENHLENQNGSHLILVNCPTLECTKETNNGVHICIKPIGLFTLKPKCSFLLNFDMVFIAFLFRLGGPDPYRGAVWMCYIIQVIFVLCVICMLRIMVVCGDIGMHDYC